MANYAITTDEAAAIAAEVVGEVEHVTTDADAIAAAVHAASETTLCGGWPDIAAAWLTTGRARTELAARLASVGGYRR